MTGVAEVLGRILRGAACAALLHDELMIAQRLPEMRGRAGSRLIRDREPVGQVEGAAHVRTPREDEVAYQGVAGPAYNERGAGAWHLACRLSSHLAHRRSPRAAHRETAVPPQRG